ncbi:MAG: hypothetical protein LBT92_02160 [Rickettsiales bacterium]|jgi:hypothetical protein|nr:hypothetical protein [Rickettsiales bacterium]
MKVVLTGVDPFFPIIGYSEPKKITGIRAKVSAWSADTEKTLLSSDGCDDLMVDVQYAYKLPPVYVDIDLTDSDRKLYEGKVRGYGGDNYIPSDAMRTLENKIYGRIVGGAAKQDIAFKHADRLQISVREVIVDNNEAYVIMKFSHSNATVGKDGRKPVYTRIGHSSSHGLNPTFEHLMHETRDLKLGRGGR